MRLRRREVLKIGGVAALGALTGCGRLGGAGVSWPAGRVLPAFAAPAHLDVADISHLDGDTQTLLTTLQGVVNRSRPRLYWRLSGDGTDRDWLETFGIPYTPASDPWSLVAKYRSEVRGVVVSDPGSPDSINVATILAGLEDAVVASPALSARLTAAPYRLPVVHDFRGAFTNNIEAYTWALQQLWPRCDHRLLCGVAGGNPVPAPGVRWTTLARVAQHVHDGSNRAEYTFDLSRLVGGDAVYVRFQDAYANDGWGPSVSQVTVTADGTTLADFQATKAGEAPFLFDADGSSVASGGWRFADQGTSFTYRFAPPAGTKTLTMRVLMWNQYLVTATGTTPTVTRAAPDLRDLIVATRAFVCWLDPQVPDEYRLFGQILAKYPPTTPYLGWFVAGHESHGVTLCAQHGVEVLAADLLTNPTVLGGIRTPLQRARPSAGATLRPRIYVTFTYSEGDNLQYDEHRLRLLWDDPKRGAVPANWSVSPLLIDAAPAMLSHYRRTATANDHLVAGPSGAGYTYPGVWPASMVEDFTRLTGRYLRRTGLDVIYALNRDNDTDLPMSAALADSYRRNANPAGILYNWESAGRVATIAGLPVATQVGISSVADGRRVLDAAGAAWDGRVPLFVAVGVLAWNMGPTELAELVAGLGAQFEVVTADVFFNLFRKSSAATP